MTPQQIAKALIESPAVDAAKTAAGMTAMLDEVDFAADRIQRAADGDAAAYDGAVFSLTGLPLANGMADDVFFLASVMHAIRSEIRLVSIP